MSESVGNIGLDLEVNSKGFNKQLNSIAGNAQSMAGGVFKKLGLAIGGAFAVKKLFDFGSAAIGLASNLSEVQNVVDVTFGAMSQNVNDFAKSALASYGMSELSAKKFTSTMGAMLKSSGLAGKQMLDMSKGVTGLAGDMASFYNLDQQEAFDKIRSGISGETEPLRQLGVNMSVANLEAYALTQGIKKQYQAMSQAEQTLLRYNYLLSVTKDAQGDFARTSGSWANQVRLLSEQWKTFQGTLGSAFISLLTPMLQVLNAFIAKLQIAAQYFKAFVELITGVKSSAASTGVAVADVGTSAVAAGQGVKKAGKDAKGSLAGFDELNVMADSASSALEDTGIAAAAGGGAPVDMPAMAAPVSPDTSAITAALQPLKTLLDDIIAPLKEISFEPLVKAFGNLKKAIAPFTETLFAGLKWAYENVLVPISKFVITQVLPTFLDALAGAFTILNSILVTIKPYLMYLWDNFLQPIAAWTGGIIATVLRGIADGLLVVGTWMWDNKPILEDIVLVLGSFALAFGAVTLAMNLGTIALAAYSLIMTVSTAVTGAFAAVMAVVTSPVFLVVAAIGALIAIVVLMIKHWDDVKKIAVAVWEAIVKAWEEAGKWFNEKIIIPIAKFFTGLWNGIKTGASGTWTGISNAFKAAGTWFNTTVILPVAKFFTTLWTGIKTGVSGAWKSISDVFIGVGKWFSDKVTSPIATAFTTVWNGIKSGFSGAFEFIKLGIKTFINGYIGVVEGFANAFIRGINFIIGAINKIKIDVPGWLEKLTGMSTFGFNIGAMNDISIPRLATGGIVDSPTLAMIGEKGKEAVVPLENTSFVDSLASAVASAVLQAMQFANGGQGNSGSDDQELVLKIGDTELARVLLSALRKEAIRTGVTVLQGV